MTDSTKDPHPPRKTVDAEEPEFYAGEFAQALHMETALGSIAYKPSLPELASTAIDPVNAFFTDGVLYLDAKDDDK